MQCDMDSLVALCDKTGNDIRSSMNTLQFLSKRGSKITAKMISQLNIGQKDQEKSLFTIMNEIFLKRDFKRLHERLDNEPCSFLT